MSTSLGLKKGAAKLPFHILIYMTALLVGSTGVGDLHAFVKVKILTGVYISYSVIEPNLTNMLEVRFAVFVKQLWRIGYTLYLSALGWILSGRNI